MPLALLQEKREASGLISSTRIAWLPQLGQQAG
jgi:hypothetical protein